MFKEIKNISIQTLNYMIIEGTMQMKLIWIGMPLLTKFYKQKGRHQSHKLIHLQDKEMNKNSRHVQKINNIKIKIPMSMVYLLKQM